MGMRAMRNKVVTRLGTTAVNAERSVGNALGISDLNALSEHTQVYAAKSD